MILTMLVADTQLDRGKFLIALRGIDGTNYASEVDRRSTGSVLSDDIAIMDKLAGRGISDSMFSLTYMFAGPLSEIDYLMDSCPGMTHVTGKIDKPYLKLVTIHGTVQQWASSVIGSCNHSQGNQNTRKALSTVHTDLCGKGLRRLFDDYQTSNNVDGTLLLIGN